MNPTEYRNTDGKPLPKSYQKTLAKLSAAHWLRSDYPDNEIKWKLTNPYSGAEVHLTTFAYDLANWILSSNPYGTGKGFTRSDWDNARYTFAILWPDAYFDLID